MSNSKSDLRFGFWRELWARFNLPLSVTVEELLGVRAWAFRRRQSEKFLAALDDLDELELSRAVAILTGEVAYFGMSRRKLACCYDESYRWWGDKRLRGISFDRIRSVVEGNEANDQAVQA